MPHGTSRPGPGVFSASRHRGPSATFHNQENIRPGTLGRGNGCQEAPWLPSTASGHNPLNNEMLLCLCLSSWQGCSFQVLLITTLLATLRFSIAAQPAQLHFCMFSTSKSGCSISVPPGPTCPCLSPPAGDARLLCPPWHDYQPDPVSSAGTCGCSLGPKPQICPEHRAQYRHRYPNTCCFLWAPLSIDASALARENAERCKTKS